MEPTLDCVFITSDCSTAQPSSCRKEVWEAANILVQTLHKVGRCDGGTHGLQRVFCDIFHVDSTVHLS